jgi:hypothetical protein
MRQSRIWLSVLLALSASAQTVQFPTLQCDTLSGKHLTMPAAAQGNPALFIVGFTPNASEQTNYWTKHIPKDLVTTYSIAVLENTRRLLRPMKLSELSTAVRRDKKNFTTDKLDRFLVIYSNEKELKEAVGFEAPDEAYLILIAPDGSVQWRFHGAFTHTALKDLRDHLHAMRQ